jgi:hypothetical protein
VVNSCGRSPVLLYLSQGCNIPNSHDWRGCVRSRIRLIILPVAGSSNRDPATGLHANLLQALQQAVLAGLYLQLLLVSSRWTSRNPTAGAGEPGLVGSETPSCSGGRFERFKPFLSV